MTLDELDTLVTAADPALGKAIPDGSSAEARWRYLQFTATTGRPARADGLSCGGTVKPAEDPSRARRRRVTVGLALAVPAVAAAVVLVLALLPSPATAPSAAAAVLLDAATAAGQALPLAAGEYLYTETQTEIQLTLYTPTSTGGTTMTEVATKQYGTTTQSWIDSLGTATVEQTTGAAQFPSAADRMAWQAVTRAIGPTPAAGDPIARSVLSDGSPHPAPSSLDVSSLPTAPTALAAALASGEYGTNALYLTGPDAVFERAATLLIGPDQGMTPALAKALFQVMATQPGAELLGTVTDHSGQQGDAVSIPSAGTFGPIEAVVDPTTGALLEADYAPATSPHFNACGGQLGASNSSSAPTCLRPVSELSMRPAWTDVVASGVVGSATATVPPDPGATVTRTLVPGAPTGLAVVSSAPSTPGSGSTSGSNGSSSTSIELSWIPPIDAGASPVIGYVLRHHTGSGHDGAGGTTGTAVAEPTTLVTGTTYSWTVGPGTASAGTYTVQAVNADGAGPASSPVTVP